MSNSRLKILLNIAAFVVIFGMGWTDLYVVRLLSVLDPALNHTVIFHLLFPLAFTIPIYWLISRRHQIMQRIHQGVEKYKEENARKEAEYQIIREAERQKIEMERQHEEQIARQQAELTRQRQEAEAAASRSGNDDFVEEEFGSIWTENSARLAKDIESPKAETRVGTVGGNSFLPAADDKTCFVCGKTGDPFTRVIPYLCSSCVSQLSPAHKAEFKAIGWKRLPGVIVMLAALCVSIANLMTDLTTRATNWTNTFLGFGCFIVGFLVNLGIASSLKTKYKEFALKIAQEKKHAPISNPVPSGQSCPACHARISSNATFCGSCGRKVDGKVDFV